MARSRILKPEFFRSEDVAGLSAHARLLFAGLWTIADRDGRMLDRPRKFGIELFPWEPHLEVEPLLRELARPAVSGTPLITRYVAGGHICLQINNFAKHQKPHFKEPSLGLPPPPTDTGTHNPESSGSDGSSSGEPGLDPSDLPYPDPVPGSDPVSSHPPRDPTAPMLVPAPYRPPATPYPLGAATIPFLDVFDRYPNKNAKAAAAAVFQDLASTYPGGEVALSKAISSRFDAGLLEQHPYKGEARFRPSFETFLAKRRWEDPASNPDDAPDHAARGSPRAGPRNFVQEAGDAAINEALRNSST